MLGLESLLQIALAACRIGGLVIAMPVFGAGPIPPQTKFLFTIAIAAMLHGLMPPVPQALWADEGAMVLVIARELGIGLLVGYSARLLFLVVSMSMEFAGLQMGFAVANLFDPQNNTQVSVLGQLAVVLTVLFFFATNLHHDLFRTVVRSFQVLPPALPSWDGGKLGEQLTQFLSIAFGLALRVALPVLVTMLLINLLMGVISRTAPQMNLFFNVSFIVTIVTGLLLVALTFPRLLLMVRGFNERMLAHGYGLW
ncbi:MAG: flagellar biosynthetic protein FliR [Deltaproteobacteria bacterium]|nr:flagellar biosynthetic protein FliR [Deltaproteobacteria bacterium]